MLAGGKSAECATYIGIRPHAQGKAHAGVSFYSETGPKFGPLTSIQRGFVKQIAQWIGLKVEAHATHQGELLRKESKLRLIFDSVPQSLWLIDADHRIIRANTAAAASAGQAPDAVVGADINAVLSCDPEWRQSNEAALASGNACFNVVARTVEPGGTARWTSTDRIPYPDPATHESRLLIVAADITQLKAHEAALAASHERFQRLYRHTPVMMCSFFRDRRIVVASDALLAATGRAREDVIGRDVCELLDPASQATLALDILPSLAHTGHCHAVPLRVLAMDQSVVEVEFSAYVETEPGAEPCYFCVLADVTARNRAQDELQRANQRLATANDGLEKFAHVASHDLQEPLRKISVFGKILIEEHREKLDGDAAPLPRRHDRRGRAHARSRAQHPGVFLRQQRAGPCRGRSPRRAPARCRQ